MSKTLSRIEGRGMSQANKSMRIDPAPIQMISGYSSIRPIHHQTDDRINAHIFISFMAYCLWVTLKHRLRALAPGLTPAEVLSKMAAIQMLDVKLPTTDGRTVILTRHTEPGDDQKLLLNRLHLELPPQPPPKIESKNPPL